MAVVYLSLGSNTGNRAEYIQQAVKLLDKSDNFNVIRFSALYETEPWGYKNQDWFLNAVIEAKTDLAPVELLHFCQHVEQLLGRVREGVPRWGKRTIDIDILLYNNDVINLPELTVPHSYMHERAFVLVPLLELVPLLKHPVLNKTISELHEKLKQPEDVLIYGAVEV